MPVNELFFNHRDKEDSEENSERVFYLDMVLDKGIRWVVAMNVVRNFLNSPEANSES